MERRYCGIDETAIGNLADRLPIFRPVVSSAVGLGNAGRDRHGPAGRR
jgi:hypothetical protein